MSSNCCLWVQHSIFLLHSSGLQIQIAGAEGTDIALNYLMKWEKNRNGPTPLSFLLLATCISFAFFSIAFLLCNCIVAIFFYTWAWLQRGTMWPSNKVRKPFKKCISFAATNWSFVFCWMKCGSWSVCSYQDDLPMLMVLMILESWIHFLISFINFYGKTFPGCSLYSKTHAKPRPWDMNPSCFKEGASGVPLWLETW